jgi:alpha-beta hydrolase superfamily lysophospholipase
VLCVGQAEVDSGGGPYEDTTLPGYLFLVDDSGTPRPTLLYHGGYDSTLEENYFALAAGALRRGYNVIAFDGPGQGSTVREQGLHFRPDWEAVVTPVVDFALTVPEVDAERLVLVGTSLGGILVGKNAMQQCSGHRFRADRLAIGHLGHRAYQILQCRVAG